MIIKWLLIPGIILAVVIALRSRSSLRGQARRKISAFLVVVAGVLAILFPGLLQALATAVGVVRGTDLLLYVLAVVIIYLVGSSSVRFREHESRLVLLARQVALSQAELGLAESRTEEIIDNRESAALPTGRVLTGA